MPFIDINGPNVSPFIGRKTPFVRNKGFTLVELIVTLTIAGILMAMAAPSMFTFLSNNRLTSQVNELIADISLARSEAIKRNTTAGICVASGTNCTTGTDWADGWLVYYDNGGTNVVIKTREALSGDNTLAGPASALAYDKSGFLSSATATTFTLCDPKQRKSRVVDVLPTGRPTLSEGSC